MAATSHPLATLGGDRHAARRRHRGRCGGRGGRDALRRRAAHDRHRRRLLLRWSRSRASRSGATTAPAAPAPRPRTKHCAAQGLNDDRHFDPCRHRAGRDRCLGGDPQGAWPFRARPRAARRRSAMPKSGFPVALAYRLGLDSGMCTSSPPIPARRKHYLFNGKAPTEGDVIRLPALGADAEDDRRQRRARFL